MKIEIKCDHCGKIIPEMVDSKPTYYGKGVCDKLVEIICIDCWNNGIRYKQE